MSRLVFALYSPAMQSGKTTVAEYFEARGAQPVKFGGALKAMVTALLMECGEDEATVKEAVYGSLKELPIRELGGKSSRQLQQTLGTEWGRNMVHPDIWLNTAELKVAMYQKVGLHVVIDDLRFPNEYERLRKRSDTVLIKVIRPGNTYTGGHGSEGLLEDRDFDHVVYNTGGPQDFKEVLHTQVDHIISRYLG
ncbi:hypothetical protein [Cupriavidus sp. RAF12]|uniref:deoxynucleotide monophosphate kinase family protein n=1 Tax=Cupriavidus sp. RAF12 TaxID=3233050 RepID=UPI003F92C102